MASVKEDMPARLNGIFREGLQQAVMQTNTFVEIWPKNYGIKRAGECKAAQTVAATSREKNGILMRRIQSVQLPYGIEMQARPVDGAQVVPASIFASRVGLLPYSNSM